MDLKNLWNMKVTIIPIVIGAFGTVTKGLLKDLGFGSWQTSGDHPNDSIIENGQNTEKESRRLEETCCHLISSEIPSAYADVKTLMSK